MSRSDPNSKTIQSIERIADESKTSPAQIMALGYQRNFIHREGRSHYLYIEHRAVSILGKSTSLRHVEGVQSLTYVGIYARLQMA